MGVPMVEQSFGELRVSYNKFSEYLIISKSDGVLHIDGTKQLEALLKLAKWIEEQRDACGENGDWFEPKPVENFT